MNIKPVIFIGWGKKACDLISTVKSASEVPAFFHGYGSKGYSFSESLDIDFNENKEIETELNNFILHSIGSVEKNLISIAQNDQQVTPCFQVIIVCTLFEQLYEDSLTQLLQKISEIGKQQEKYVLDVILVGLNAAPDFSASDKVLSFKNADVIKKIFNETEEFKLFRSFILFDISFNVAETGFADKNSWAKALENFISREQIWNGFEMITPAFSSRLHDERECMAGSMGIHSLGYLPEVSEALMALCMKNEILKNGIIGDEKSLKEIIDSLPETIDLQELFYNAIDTVYPDKVELDMDSIDMDDTYDSITAYYNRKEKEYIEEFQENFDSTLEHYIPELFNHISTNYGRVLLKIIEMIKGSDNSLISIFDILVQKILTKNKIDIAVENFSEYIKEIKERESISLPEKQKLYLIEILDDFLKTCSFDDIKINIKTYIRNIYSQVNKAEQSLNNAQLDLEDSMEKLDSFSKTFGVFNKIFKSAEYKKEKLLLESKIQENKEKRDEKKLILEALIPEKEFLCHDIIKEIFLPFSIMQSFYNKFLETLDTMDKWIQNLNFEISQIPSLRSNKMPALPDYEEAIINLANCESWYADFRPQMDFLREPFFQYYRKNTDTDFKISVLAFNNDNEYLEVVDQFCHENMAFMEELTLSDILLRNPDNLSAIIKALFERSAPFTGRNKNLFIPQDDLFISNYVLTSEKTKDTVSSVFNSYEQIQYLEQRKDNDITVIRIESGYPIHYIANYQK